jgi:putative molybdopterin biosynthesis protein
MELWDFGSHYTTQGKKHVCLAPPFTAVLLLFDLSNRQSLEDLQRPDVTFINRQRGAGTRVLLDYALGQLGLSSEGIRGYEQEEYTHLAVAAAIKSGRADCGLGIAAAARALELEFIPLYQERYDLVVPLEHARSQLLAPLWKVLEDPAFRQAVSSLPGYNITPMGKLIAEMK